MPSRAGNTFPPDFLYTVWVKVSFVIPAYNEEKLIGACLQSVLIEIERGRFDAEVIVVNNASTDRTRDMASSFDGVRIVDEPRKGLTRARQTGFEASSGEIIANIDADTKVPPGWLTTVMDEFTHDQALVALSGPFIYYDISAIERAQVKAFYMVGYFIQNVLRAGVYLQGGNFVLRRDALMRAGGFDTTIEFYGEDTDIALRIKRHGKVKWTFKLPMYTSGRRLHEEGVLETGFRYALNFFSTTLSGRPVTKTHVDVRS